MRPSRPLLRRAFTLIELTAVIVVLAILATVGLITYGKVVSRAQDSAAQAQLTQIGQEAQSLAAYRGDGTLTTADLTSAAADATAAGPALSGSGTAAAAVSLSTTQFDFSRGPAQLHGSVSADARRAGLARAAGDPATARCTLATVPATGKVVVWTTGALGANCSGDTALNTTPGTDPGFLDPASSGVPSAPTGVNATQNGANGINVVWNANPETGLAGYRVLVDGAVFGAPVTSGTSTALTGVPAGDHTITVVAYRTNGATSAASVASPVSSQPAIPAGLSVASVTGNPVVLSWTAVPDAVGYHVYRDGNLLTTIATNSPGYTDASVTAGSGYRYAVDAYAGGGQSPRSGTVTAVPGSAYAAAVLADNPTSYWQLDEASGTTTSNLAASGAASNGTYTGSVTPAQGSGPIGYLAAQQSPKFSGGYATMPSGSLMGTTQTLVAWFRTTTAGGVVVGYQDAPIGGTITQHVPAIYVDTTGHLRGEFWMGLSSSAMSSAGVVNDGTWHMAVLTGSVNTQSLYLDGKLVGTLSGTIQPLNMTYTQIGNGYADSWPSAGANPFSGQIGQVAVFPTALTAAQVATLENASLARYSQAVLAASPTSYWRMNEYNSPTAENLATGGTARNATYSTGLASSAGPIPGDSTSRSITFSNGSMALPANALNATTQTLVTWFKTSTAGGVIAGYQNNATPDSGTDYVPALYVDTTGHLEGQFWNGTKAPVASTVVVNDGKWHMAVLAAGASSQSLYLDGALVGTLSGALQPLDMTYAQIGNGRNASYPGAGTEPFSGQIAETAIFPTALSQAQVSTLIAASK